MPAPKPSAPAPLYTPFGLVLLVVFLLALLAAALSTRGFVKRVDLPPPGTYLVVAGEENQLFVKLAQRSIKGLHRAVGLRGQLEVPGETNPRPLLVRSENSTEWETKIKRPPAAPGGKPSDIESNIIVLIGASIPAAPELYGRTIPATFDLDMVVPRIDPQNPKAGQSMPDRIQWTMPLQIQPPGFQRLYQRINRIALIVAGSCIALALLRTALRRFAQRRR